MCSLQIIEPLTKKTREDNVVLFLVGRKTKSEIALDFTAATKLISRKQLDSFYWKRDESSHRNLRCSSLPQFSSLTYIYPPFCSVLSPLFTASLDII